MTKPTTLPANTPNKNSPVLYPTPPDTVPVNNPTSVDPVPDPTPPGIITANIPTPVDPVPDLTPPDTVPSHHLTLVDHTYFLVKACEWWYDRNPADYYYNLTEEMIDNRWTERRKQRN